MARMVEAVSVRGCGALWFALHSGLVSEREEPSQRRPVFTLMKP